MLFYIYMSYVLLRFKFHILKLTFSLHVYAFLNNCACQVTVGIWGGHKQLQVLNYMLLRPTYRKTFGKAIHFWGSVFNLQNYQTTTPYYIDIWGILLSTIMRHGVKVSYICCFQDKHSEIWSSNCRNNHSININISVIEYLSLERSIFANQTSNVSCSLALTNIHSSVLIIKLRQSYRMICKNRLV